MVQAVGGGVLGIGYRVWVREVREGTPLKGRVPKRTFFLWVLKGTEYLRVPSRTLAYFGVSLQPEPALKRAPHWRKKARTGRAGGGPGLLKSKVFLFSGSTARF